MYEVTALAKESKEKYTEQKTIWLYTGSTWEQIQTMKLMKYVDVLVDGEFEVDKKDATLHWKGSSIRR